MRQSCPPQNLFPVLQEFRKRRPAGDRAACKRRLRTQLAKARGEEKKKEALNAFKDREMFLIDMQHLAEPTRPLQSFSHALTHLAEAVLDEAYGICYRKLRRKYGRRISPARRR